MSRICLGEFDSNANTCLSGCKELRECAKKSGVNIDESVQARIDYKKGKITLQEMVKRSWKKKKVKKGEVKIPNVEIRPMPKVDPKIEDRMSFLNN